MVSSNRMATTTRQANQKKSSSIMDHRLPLSDCDVMTNNNNNNIIDNNCKIANMTQLSRSKRFQGNLRPLVRPQTRLLLQMLLASVALACIVQLVPTSCEAAIIRHKRNDETAATANLDEEETNTGPEVAVVASTSTTTTTTTTTAAPAFDSSNTSERPKSKIPPINFTLVDELFNESLEDDAVTAKWRRMDKTLTDGKFVSIDQDSILNINQLSW